MSIETWEIIFHEAFILHAYSQRFRRLWRRAVLNLHDCTSINTSSGIQFRLECNDKKCNKGREKGWAEGCCDETKKQNRIMSCAHGKSRKKGSDYTGGWKRDSDPRTCRQELWVSHIFADVRTTKSFSLAALFSTRKSCSVTALSYVRNSRGSVACEAKRLVLSSSFSSTSFSFSRKSSRFQ